MQKRSTVAVWFEIPADDFDRATRFYESIFGIALKRETMGSHRLGVFPYDRDKGISGCVIAGPDLKPGDDGVAVYLNADGTLDEMLRNVEPAGGIVLTPIVSLPDDMGRFAHIRDTEGNRVGLHTSD